MGDPHHTKSDSWVPSLVVQVIPIQSTSCASFILIIGHPVNLHPCSHFWWRHCGSLLLQYVCIEIVSLPWWKSWRFVLHSVIRWERIIYHIQALVSCLTYKKSTYCTSDTSGHSLCFLSGRTMISIISSSLIQLHWSSFNKEVLVGTMWFSITPAS